MKTLVAGVGNIFFGDDGFGPAVIRALAGSLDGVRVEDYGIRGLHLAYELLSGYDRAILIDALPRGGTPGTLYVIEPDPTKAAATADAHRMDLSSVFAFMRTLGGATPPLILVGCEPAGIEEGMELSPPVAEAVERAAALVRRIVAGESLLGKNEREIAWSAI